VDHDLELAYLGLEVPDLAALTAFFAEVVGLIPGEPGPAGSTTWRNDDKAHRVFVREGPANDAVCLGVEATRPEAFDATTARLAGAGFEVQVGTEDEARSRRVGRLATVRAPWGVTVEVVHGLGDAATPFSSPLVPGGFLTHGVGFGHVVFATTAFEESHRFLVDGLGLARTDRLETEIAPGIALEVTFYHCNQRHHSVALAAAPFELPQALHHFMVETNERDDVGRAFDRAWAADLELPNGLGRHDNDEMFSFYVESPAGFSVEIGHGARTVTAGWDDDRTYDRISRWGHQPLRSGAGGS
jgi:2,3-dihydroxybiphenyl 1,2-dioxygenase